MVALEQDRATEIISSSLNFEVTWQGKPVWLETVNKMRQTATIVVLGGSDKREVPVTDLVETGNFD